MGYRSDVKYVMAFATEEARTKFLGEAALIVADHPDQDVRDIPSAYELDTYERRTKPFIIRVHHEEVKWFLYINSVRIETELVRVAEDDYDADFEFLRIGEDHEDIDSQTSKDILGGDFIEYHRYSEFC